VNEELFVFLLSIELLVGELLHNCAKCSIGALGRCVYLIVELNCI